MLKRLTPILTVESIEPCLPFWEAHLGFTVTAKVPAEGPLLFAQLERDGIEIMYQTRQQLENDLQASFPTQGTLLYLEVDDIQPIATAVPAETVAVPLRTTFYGAKEIFVREPGGNLIGFAEQQQG